MSKKIDPGMRLRHFNLGDELYIELFKLLKVLDLAGSGGEAKFLISDGLVKLNGATEYRKRAKIRPGDTVEISGYLIRIEK